MLAKINNKISIILPTLNESGHIESLIENILKYTKLYNREIIVVDDNSNDGTISILKKLKKQKKIKFISRLGKKSLRKSIQTGINKSKGNIICWMDADFSHHPKYLPQIINAVIFGDFDLAVNVRNFYKRKDNKFLHAVLSLILNISLRIILSYNFKDYTSGFICIKKKIFENYNLEGDYGEYFISLMYFCIKNKFKIKQLNYIEFFRRSGTSKTGSNILDFIKRGIKYYIIAIKCIVRFNFLKKIT
jgi:dolichol-phosphate mannosyltransferase